LCSFSFAKILNIHVCLVLSCKMFVGSFFGQQFIKVLPISNLGDNSKIYRFQDSKRSLVLFYSISQLFCCSIHCIYLAKCDLKRTVWHNSGCHECGKKMVNFGSAIFIFSLHTAILIGGLQMSAK
jgi:hypothetical protein